MLSEKQLQANRANSLKSTGPTTQAGRTRSSLNALKHGCTSQTMIFPGEDSQHFHKFHQSLIKDLAPQGALEESMVQELAQTQWSITRTRAYEATLFALGHEQHAETFKTDGDQVIQAAFAGAVVFKAEGNALKNIGLYLQRHSRMFLNTLKVLREIQAARKAADQAQLEQAIHFADLNRQLAKPGDLKDLGFDYAPEVLAAPLRRLTLLRTAEPDPKAPHNPHIHVTTAA